METETYQAETVETEVTEIESSFLIQIGERIKLNRKSRGLSRAELSSMVNLSESFLGIIERGEKGTRLFNLVNICDALGIKLNDVVYNSGATKAMFAERTKELTSAKREKINCLIHNMNEKQLDFIITTINGLKSFEPDSQKDEK